MENQVRDNLIDMKEAMEILGISRTTFYRMMKEGKISGMKPGGQWRFDRDDILRLLKAPGKDDRVETEAGLRQALDIYRRLLLEENEIDDEKLKELIPLFGEDFAGEESQDPESDNLSEQLTDLIILKATMDRVSDIHIEPYGKKVRIRHRDTGTLYQVTLLPFETLKILVKRIKEISGCNPETEGIPQDGRFERVMGKEMNLVCRVSIFPCIEGDSAIMRILDRNVSIPPVNGLGLNSADNNKLRDIINSKSGLIIFTGPTGSGKTSAIYSCLQEIKSEKKNIVTIEDPVEISFEGINQSQIKPDKGYDFSKAVRSMLRNDADVLMVGEIRDEETALTVIQSAITGHLVFTALHTNTAASAVARLSNLGIEPFLIKDALSAVVGCRVVRKICNECREEVLPDRDLLKKASLGAGVSKIKFYKGRGCKNCHGSGYKGNTGIYEVLIPDVAMGELLDHGPEATEIENAASKCVTNDLRSEALRKVNEGITTLEEIYEKVLS